MKRKPPLARELGLEPLARRRPPAALQRAGGGEGGRAVRLDLLSEEGEHRRERELHHAEGLVEHKLCAAARRAVDRAAVQPVFGGVKILRRELVADKGGRRRRHARERELAVVGLDGV